MAKKKSTKKTTKTTTPAVASAPPQQKILMGEPVAPEAFVSNTYNSQYADQLNSALNTVTNWKYDPMQDASYQALAKVYGARGNVAAKNSLADAAALNGGYGTSYAVSAAQQARNQYNQELASLIPDLENTAYNRAQGTLSALRDADDTAYNRFRDTESDRQWAWTNEYNKYRDLLDYYQFAVNYNYQMDRDAAADRQLAQQYNASKKGSSGGGGGRRSSGGGSGGYTTGSGMGITKEEWENAGKRDGGSNSKKRLAYYDPKIRAKRNETAYREGLKSYMEKKKDPIGINKKKDPLGINKKKF